MRYAYFPGCSLKATAIEYDMSTRAIAEKLGVELWEIPEWNCCGATPAHSSDTLLSIALAARSMAIAEREGLDVVLPCAACFSRMRAAENAVREDGTLRNEVARTIGMDYRATNRARALVDAFVNGVGLSRIRSQVTHPLAGFRVACYYGCLLVKPPEVAGLGDPEYPIVMDELVEALGATSIDWALKTECCGASLAIPRADIVVKLVGEILDSAIEGGANCIATACPLCQMNLDMRQVQAGRKRGTSLNIPVFYFTELMGLAFGIEAGRLGVKKHCVNASRFLKETLMVAR